LIGVDVMSKAAEEASVAGRPTGICDAIVDGKGHFTAFKATFHLAVTLNLSRTTISCTFAFNSRRRHEAETVHPQQA
jgi:hypothetical protein